MSRPALSRVPSFYHNYIDLVDGDDLNALFRRHVSEMQGFFEAIPDGKWDYRYAEGKWNIRELVQHIVDAERIFGYRALRFARKDQTPLAGFDENTFAAASNAGVRTKSDLMEELNAVTTATALLFKSFNGGMLDCEGVANGKSISVRAIGFVVIGHAAHHRNVISERYLK